MAGKEWIFDKVARGSEESYFRQREEKLLAELRRKVDQERARRGLAEELNVFDERVLAALEDLGFTRETLVLLHIVPLIQVAWSDGKISGAERKKIVEVAAARGIVPGTPAYAKLEQLLESRPAEEGFEACLRVIRAMFTTLPEAQRRAVETDLPAFAAAVARASGGVLGVGAVDAAEKAVLDRIAREIAEAHADAARGVVGGGTAAKSS
jgi:hypothetical protein